MTCGVRASERALSCFFAVTFVAVGLAVGRSHAVPPQQRASRFVEEALEAELAGETARRAELLAKARETDRKSTAARWQSGQVMFDGEWLTIAEVAERSAANKLRTDYEERRAEMADDAEGHLALARWCDRSKLRGQAQFHWKNVLAAEPTNEAALRALRLYEYQGALYTTEEINERKQAAEQEQRGFKRYTAKFDVWLRDAAGDDSAVREAALRNFGEVSDVAALPALQRALVTPPSPQAGPLSRLTKDRLSALREELALAFVSALSKMPEHASTLALVDSAVYAEWPAVRQRAAQALRPRQATDYVPLLMGALRAPLEVDASLDLLVDGVLLTEVVRQETPESVIVNKRDTAMSTVRLNPNPERWADFSTGYRHRLMAQASRTAAQISATNASIAALNERVLAVLDVTTDGLKLGPNPRVWWQAWQQFNELHVAEKSTVEVNQFNEYEQQVLSCFAAGTPVWTEIGAVPIERIRPGDVVLSQDPETGELAYRPVMLTTIRPPSPLMLVEVEGDEIATTRGHRFWVDGMGWEMAKFLTHKMRLHAVDRGVEIKSVRPYSEGDGLEAYNLVVDEFHTYFVGASRLLVCDNSCPRPTLAAIPGMKRLRNLAATFTSNGEIAEENAENASSVTVESEP